MTRWVRALCIVSLLLPWGPLKADIVWKVADEGPRTPVVTEIVGDDARTIAVTVGGAAEFDGARWLPVALNTDSVLPKERTMYAVGGQIGAYAISDGTLRLFLLRGSTWSLAASVPFSYQPFECSYQTVVPRGADRIYLPDPAFSTCQTRDGCPAGAAARRLRSLSLVDGSIREEADLPVCAGYLFGLADRLFVIFEAGPCGGGCPSGTGSIPRALGTGTPFYRLDGDRWTQLEPWTRPFPYTFTTSAAWLFENDAVTSARSLVLLTPSGFSPPIPLPAGQVTGNPRPFEWNGRMLLSAEKLYEVRDGALLPFAPACPIPGDPLFAAGTRLFAWTEGWKVAMLSGSAWEETSGVPEIPGGQVFLKGRTKLFSIRGNRLFRRDDSAWVGLPPSPSSAGLRYFPARIVVLGDDPVLLDQGYGVTYGAYRFDASSGQWLDLHLPPAFRGAALTHGGDLLVGGRDYEGGGLALWHQGTWTTHSPGSSVWNLGEANGRVFVFGCLASGSASGVCELESGELVPAFPGLEALGLQALDVTGLEGETLIEVTDLTPPGYPQFLRRVLVSAAPEGYRTVLRQGDLRDAGHGSYGQDLLSPLVPFGRELLLPLLSFNAGQLRAQRSPMVPSVLDPEGRFAFRDSTSTEYSSYRGPLLVPSPRVRKNLAAAVDTAGVGGARYRSVLLVANFSETASAVARVFKAAQWDPYLEIPLGPRAQVAIDDPAPGFLGPLAVEFEGLTEEADAWAAIRVWSPSDGGTAGTAIIGTNPGVVAGSAMVVPPLLKAGCRTHAAFSASGDGARGPMDAFACPLDPWPPGEACVNAGLLTNGGFFQGDVPEAGLRSPIQFSSWCHWNWCYPLQRTDDLGGYLVRNEEKTNDGAIVPFERPDVMEGRRTRFLPALVSLSSERGRYRTELTLGWRSQDTWSPLSRDFDVTFRNSEGAWTIPVSIPARQVLEIPDAGAWLVANGVPVDPANVDGTLTFTSDREEGAANLLVTAIVTARGPGASGDYGVSVPVFNEVEWVSTEAIVPGLREDGSFRSNLALASPEPAGGPSVTLEVSIHRASDGKAVGTLPQVWLSPGQRVQLNRLLATIDYSGDAFAVVRRTAGTGRFVAYAVMNDNVTGDGTLFPMTRAR